MRRDVKIEPKYSGPNRTGVCRCGHSWEDHHTSAVLSEEYIDITGEVYFPEECEYFGANEAGGLDEKGMAHCFAYRDEKE